MRRCYLLMLLLLTVYTNTSAQLTGLLEIGLGAQGHNQFYDYGVGIGQTFKDNRTLFTGGVKMQKYLIVPTHKLRDSETEYIGQSTSAYNFAIFVGGRYTISLKKFKKDAKFERMGFFPECRILFSPLLPFKVSYENNEGQTKRFKGDKISQFAYSVGGGLFIGSMKEGYIAVKLETSTIDMVKSLRALDDIKNGYDFPEGPQYLLSFSFYLR